MNDSYGTIENEGICDVCGHPLLWDDVERMWYCPNTWEHG